MSAWGSGPLHDSKSQWQIQGVNRLRTRLSTPPNPKGNLDDRIIDDVRERADSARRDVGRHRHRVQIGGPSLSGRFLKARTYYSIRAATDHRASPEQFQARADELSRVEA
jgi:hypothetical protein